ncbi:MAG TPA: hypothetical protein VL098_09875 [Flavipsychrobacter sp.]|nr:hypothetical protein [Flavipsychrobacter sp.]
MQKKQYRIDIHASAEKVSNTMIGKETYRQWTAAFNATSDFEGGWNTGDKICFTGVGKEGKREGMVAVIEQHLPNKYISIKHLGILDGDKEIMEGPAVEAWAGAHENYSFDEQNGITTVRVDIDTEAQYLDYFDETWPKALKKLKELSEA